MVAEKHNAKQEFAKYGWRKPDIANVESEEFWGKMRGDSMRPEFPPDTILIFGRAMQIGEKMHRGDCYYIVGTPPGMKPGARFMRYMGRKHGAMWFCTKRQLILIHREDITELRRLKYTAMPTGSGGTERGKWSVP